jgi:hypothetical protein
MGYKVTDGKAIDTVAPGATAIVDGEIYRIAGWTGCAVGSKDTTQLDRNFSMETSAEFIHCVKLPAGWTPAVGDVGYWNATARATFQKGDTHLQAAVTTAGDPPAVKVLRAKDANGYAYVRVINL